jgi:DNA polymerase III subunit epsilon
MTLSKDLFVIDVETSGENPFVHQLLSVALVPLHDSAPSLEVFVRPSGDVAWTECGRRAFRRFASDWHQKAVPPTEAMSQIEKYLIARLGTQKATLVGHNVGFDILFLRKLATETGRRYTDHLAHRTIDTHTLLYLGWLEERWPESAKTSEGAFKYFGVTIPEPRRHTALGDAEATKSLFLHLIEALAETKFSNHSRPRRAAR